MAQTDSLFERKQATVFLAPDVVLGKEVRFFGFCNAYGCKIGEFTRIGTFVEIQKGVTIGSRCKISSHTFLCEGVTLGDECFVGHGVMFTNDRFPQATNDQGEFLGDGDWKCEPTWIGNRVSIGSGAVILPGVKIGDGAWIGAGAVITKDVPARAIVAGVPARVFRMRA